VSVDHASMGCPGGYHETHDYGRAVAVALLPTRLRDVRGETP
jgi:hypothetical protein